MARAAEDVGVGEEDALARVGALQLLLGEQGVGVVLHAAVAPEAFDGLHALLGVLGVGEVVVGALGAVVHQAVPHLIAHPVDAELGVDGGPLLVTAQAAHNELVVIDVQRGLLQHVGDAVGALDLLGLAGVGQVGLGHQLGPVGGHKTVGGAGGDLQDVVDAGEGGGLGGVARQAHAPLLVIGLDGQRRDIDLVGVGVNVFILQVLSIGQSLHRTIPPSLIYLGARADPCAVFLASVLSRRPPPKGRNERSRCITNSYTLSPCFPWYPGLFASRAPCLPITPA